MQNNKIKNEKINFKKTAKKVLDIQLNGLSYLKKYFNDDFDKACNNIFSCKGKIVVMGMGKSGHIGNKIAATLASTGTPAFFVHPGEASHGDLGMITSQDIVLAISNSGESKEILTIIPILKRQLINLICMTKNPSSSMGKAANIHLCIKVPYESCPLGLTPTTSTTAMLIMGDAIAVSLLKARGFTKKDFALSHPGGILGKKLSLHVSDLINTNTDRKMPVIKKNATIKEALIEIVQKKLGIVVICDKKMKIEGIFTYKDMIHVLNTNIDLNRTKIKKIMNMKIIKIKPDMLAIDALKIMKTYKTNFLLVEKKNTLIGIINICDFFKLGIL
ncbi:MAG: KpsF/GutQ family sugar-phosphate isomerase [Arsenophonus sp.]|nr:MAG: KpsF/GutQ family sugar-phosphate isomerase [Arsenophonus sp.]